MSWKTDEHPAGSLLGALARAGTQRALETAAEVGEGLRERKKRLTRQLISDTATSMFMQRGFDSVTVAEVAAASGVSEKTVFNYFPTKESLVLDREGWIEGQIRRALAEAGPGRTVVEAACDVIAEQVHRFFATEPGAGAHPDGGSAVAASFQRFMDMIDSAPTLRAAYRDMGQRLVQVAAESLAERLGMSPQEPEPQIAADALVGLWGVQFSAIRRQAMAGRSVSEACDAVIDDVRRAGRLIDTGLWCLTAAAAGRSEREQFREAAESMGDACRQVLSALRQARAAWRQVQAAASGADAGAQRGRVRRSSGQNRKSAL